MAVASKRRARGMVASVAEAGTPPETGQTRCRGWAGRSTGSGAATRHPPPQAVPGCPPHAAALGPPPRPAPQPQGEWESAQPALAHPCHDVPRSCRAALAACTGQAWHARTRARTCSRLAAAAPLTFRHSAGQVTSMSSVLFSHSLNPCSCHSCLHSAGVFSHRWWKGRPWITVASCGCGQAGDERAPSGRGQKQRQGRHRAGSGTARQRHPSAALPTTWFHISCSQVSASVQPLYSACMCVMFSRCLQPGRRRVVERGEASRAGGGRWHAYATHELAVEVGREVCGGQPAPPDLGRASAPCICPSPACAVGMFHRHPHRGARGVCILCVHDPTADPCRVEQSQAKPGSRQRASGTALALGPSATAGRPAAAAAARLRINSRSSTAASPGNHGAPLAFTIHREQGMVVGEWRRLDEGIEVRHHHGICARKERSNHVALLLPLTQLC